MLKTEAKIRVRFSETDAMGVVYHANYLPWFEVARTQLLAKLGMPYRELQDNGFLLPVLEVSVKYRVPAHFGDDIVVRAMMKEMPRVKIKIEYEVLRGDEVLTTGMTLHAFMNRDSQAIRPPKFFTETIEKAFRDNAAGSVATNV